jgi:hypothetical protein
MYLALFSVAFGSLLTLSQIYVLFNILSLESYVASRAVLNTMNVAAPFLCLGFDSAAPVLKRMNKGFPFFWNMIIAQFLGLIFLIVIALMLPISSKASPLILGLAASMSVAGVLIIANHYRVEGRLSKYFIGLNVTDKLVRTIIISASAFLIQDIFLWSLMVSVIGFSYVGLIALQTRIPVKLDLKIFISHIHIGIPYILSVLGLIAMTRMPFYASYIFEDKLTTAKIDVWLLFSLFLLIPVLNKSKMEESKSEGDAITYLSRMKESWRAIWLQEMVVCFAILGLAFIAVYYERCSTADLLEILLPLMIGMILIASVPNYAQLLCFFSMYSLGIRISFFIAIASTLIYFPLLVLDDVRVPILFIASAFWYCLVGCVVARSVGVRIHDFWRWKHAFISIFVCCIVLLLFYMIFNGLMK